ncbi:MAG: hypothetical protein ACI9V1_001331 [Spirosomataceae bacterium]|jgi:hypothetical protein
MGSKAKKLVKEIKKALKKVISKKKRKENAELIKKTARKLAKKLLKKKNLSKSTKEPVVRELHPVVWSADIDILENENSGTVETSEAAK